MAGAYVRACCGSWFHPTFHLHALAWNTNGLMMILLLFCFYLFIRFIFSQILIEASTGIFRPVPPFGSLATVPANAIYFGSILAFQRICSKGMELIRRKEDYVNEVFGFGMVWPYYHYILNHSEKRLIRHNRFVGGSVLLAVVYANLLS